MTWAVFTLYLHDHYAPADFEVINGNMNKLMVKERGFTRFDSFSNKLLELYKEKQHKTVADLYPSIFRWCGEQ